MLHLESSLQDPNAIDSADSVIQQDSRDHLSDIFSGLTKREQVVMRDRHGLVDGRNRTWVEIADEIGKSISTAKRAQRSAITKLRGMKIQPS